MEGHEDWKCRKKPKRTASRSTQQNRSEQNGMEQYKVNDEWRSQVSFCSHSSLFPRRTAPLPYSLFYLSISSPFRSFRDRSAEYNEKIYDEKIVYTIHTNNSSSSNRNSMNDPWIVMYLFKSFKSPHSAASSPTFVFQKNTFVHHLYQSVFVGLCVLLTVAQLFNYYYIFFGFVLLLLLFFFFVVALSHSIACDCLVIRVFVCCCCYL